ncbi:hypothetical protein [Dyadobacter bucti]|uniref:hypothetical protein n=1 Tax=Dyadobacter bucti TaxID=2572203 RepID=UPI003F71E59D
MNQLELLEKRFAELANKPKTQDEVRETFDLAKRIELERAKECSDLLLELRHKGIVIESLWELVNSKKKYPEAIEILVKHLPQNYHHKNKEAIVRALTVKEAKGIATPALIKEYERTPKSKDSLRWIIGNAIATVMTKHDYPWVISTVKDGSNRESRGQLVLALGNLKSKQSEDLLMSLPNDKDVAKTAKEALRRMKSKQSKP